MYRYLKPINGLSPTQHDRDEEVAFLTAVRNGTRLPPASLKQATARQRCKALRQCTYDHETKHWKLLDAGVRRLLSSRITN